jgi:uncharacterized surface protein with fasciclin (FAS1) repeats
MTRKLLTLLLVPLLFLGCGDDDDNDTSMAGTGGGMAGEGGGEAGVGGMAGEGGTGEPEEQDIIDTAVAAGSFETLAAALTAAELVDTLKGEGPFTVFAPADDAFAELGSVVDDLLKPENKDQLVKVLTYHVVGGDAAVMSTDLQDGALVATVAGPPVAVNLSGSAPMINDAEVATVDIEATNGVIHVIDKVLLPPEDDIVATAVNTENEFTSLEAALGAAELVEALQGDGPFTVFAPTDEAFEALGDTLTDLLEPENQDQLADILLYHVVEGWVGAADLTDGGTAETLLSGKSVTFDLSSESPMVDDAKIVQANVITSNGVIHVIDKVITPAAK